MLNTINVIKTVIVCALLSAIGTFYMATSSFQKALASSGYEAGRLKSLFKMADLSAENIWIKIFASWGYTFSVSVISCLIVLLWLSKRMPNNK
jgi:hypothetical protein